MTNIKDLSIEEIINLIKQGKSEYLDILINKNWRARQVVAKQGRNKDLDVLVNDKNYEVRKAVAEVGRDQDLDILVNDKDWEVKVAVANHKRDKDLDILVNDEDRNVRMAVANQGREKDLDILVDDEYWGVRYTVAKQGRAKDLKILINDTDNWTRHKARKLLGLENREEDMEIKIKKLNKEATIPTCATLGSAGYDLYSLNEKVTIESNESYLFDTGIAIEIPKGYVGLIFARSGLASKLGLAPSTKVSVIDSDYRGDIRVSLFNHSKSAVLLEEKTRIAQLVLVPYLSCNFVEVEELEETERGTNGFGSTGTK